MARLVRLRNLCQKSTQPNIVKACFLLLLVTLAATSEALDFTYTNIDGKITITGYTGPGGNVVIPDTIDGLPVIGIGESAFSASGVTGVSFPGSLTYIGEAAFRECRSLGGLTIPNSVTYLGDSAFWSCTSLTVVTIPDSVTYLGDEAFFGCSSVTNLSIGKGVTRIGGGLSTGTGFNKYGTFEGCTSLSRVTIPDNVTNIGDGPLQIGGSDGAFYFCANLTNVTIGKGLTYLGVGAFSYCSNLTSVFFRGNAPTPGVDMFGEDIFHLDYLATVYYLPGTTGWGPTLAGVPTMLWNPQAQPGANFGVRDNSFGFDVAGTTDIPIVIEACTNSASQSWVRLQSFTLTNGLIHFSDSGWINFPARLYRIRSP